LFAEGGDRVALLDRYIRKSRPLRLLQQCADAATKNRAHGRWRPHGASTSDGSGSASGAGTASMSGTGWGEMGTSSCLPPG
jgi:hypothetical protein